MSLENQFLSRFAASLPANPFLDGDQRRSLGSLVRQGHPAALIGDAYMLAGAFHWAERQKGPDGSRARITFHGGERLFHPYSPVNEEVLTLPPDFEEKKEAFLREFEKLPIPSRALLEIEATHGGVFNRDNEMVGVSYYAFKQSLDPLGFRFADMPAIPNQLLPEDRAVLRYASASAIELGLRVFLGQEKAPRFCRALGSVPARPFNELHKRSIQAIGHPDAPEKIHALDVDAWSYPLHDLSHAAILGTRLDAGERMASSILGGAMLDLPREARRRIRFAADTLLDLDTNPGSLLPVLRGVKEKLRGRDYRCLCERVHDEVGKELRTHGPIPVLDELFDATTYYRRRR